MSVAIGRLQEALAAWPEAARGAPADTEPARAAAALLAAGEECLPDDGGALDPAARRAWLDFLEGTSRPAFLAALPDAAARRRWFEVCLAAVRRTGYDLETMLAERAASHGARPLFQELGLPAPTSWSYERVRWRVREIAATFLAQAGGGGNATGAASRTATTGSPLPRVALYADNSVDGACCDLACLAHDILVTPLNIHLDVEQLVWIFDRLQITIAVTDTVERSGRLLEVGRRTARPFTVYALEMNAAVAAGDAVLLAEATTHLAPDRAGALLAARPRRGLDAIATVMFTSGSTGRPKGVAFTPFNLVSKRFARAAALPAVGDGEVLLCYLPLYHTFGRFFEMLGMLFWRGTYVFAGNPSVETLLAGLRAVAPTGLIGVPLRWMQVRERCLAAMAQAQGATTRQAAFDAVTGGRLRWGLSAAGVLEPKIFRFFQRQGVELASGFGMTEATGGITMSPPGDYLDGTVGVPLPGIDARFTETGEMQIAGPYVARYLAHPGRDLELAAAGEAGGRNWLSTGDIFRRLERGHLAIVDRIKDIYKNDRGQTVAPLHVERKFRGVPGIRRTFLVGDHRSYNVLLIVPDREDPVLQKAPDDGSRRDYFHQIVAAANHDLTPYERVVNFALLDRDFERQRGELTAKGSFRRRVIEAHFAAQIDDLYRRAYVELRMEDGLRVRLPRWIFRDLGLLEDDIVAAEHALHDRQRRLALPLQRCSETRSGRVRIGDLEYTIDGEVVDLGLLCRQPQLWLGNPGLIAFGPCKNGWDVPLGPVAAHVMLPRGRPAHRPDTASYPRPPAGNGIADPHLIAVERLLQLALFGPPHQALSAVLRLEGELAGSDDRTGMVVRRRLAALAHHADEEVRCLAYRVLLLDEPMPDYNVAFPAFVHSGLSFLNEQSIRAIASASFEKRRLEALRRRFHSYRTQLQWPASDTVRRAFEYALRMLVDFVHQHPQYYKPVRAELSSWIVHREDTELAGYAQQQLDGLVRWFEQRLEKERPGPAPGTPEKAPAEERSHALLCFDEEIPAPRRKELRHLLLGTTFLTQSILLSFEEEEFDLDRVGTGGIWVSPIRTRGPFQLDRVGVNTTGGRHFDLLVIRRDDMDADAVRRTNYWMTAIAGYPFGHSVLPRFGCSRPELGAMSLEYVCESSVDEKIREFAAEHQPGFRRKRAPATWRKLFVRAMATFFQAWRNSGRRIVPGSLSPSNVVVPAQDFHEGAVILSLAGHEPYRNPLALFGPLHATFFRRTRALYPASAAVLDDRWLWEACIEALGVEDGLALLDALRSAIDRPPAPPFDAALVASLDAFRAACGRRFFVPLPLTHAIDRYHDWERANPRVTAEARADQVEGLLSLYRLDRFDEPARYHLYRHTYFASARPPVRQAFDRLLEVLQAEPEQPATQRVELSDLQAAFTAAEDLDVFSRLVFPQAQRPQRMEVLTYGDGEQRQVTVCTHFTDAHGEPYSLREPVDAEEVGQVYRLFFQENFPKTISEMDRYLIATDSAERVVGGICYKQQDRDVAHMDGVVVNASFGGRGIATALLEDFVTRLASRGVAIVKTGYIMRPFCEKRGFRLDRRWGGLVRALGGDARCRDSGPPADAPRQSRTPDCRAP